MAKNPRVLNINVGKNGLSVTALAEMNNLFKKYQSLKIKFLTSAIEREDINGAIEKIISSTQSRLKKKVGFTIIISKNS